MLAWSSAPPKYCRMSNFHGEITKQILSAPPRIMRSTRYSLTARGRSTPLASIQLPTGNNSFENARGWMRVPFPAAGTMPHISRLLTDGTAGVRVLQCGDQIRRASLRTVLIEHPLAGAARNRRQLRARSDECRDRRLRVVRHQYLAARLEERIEPVPLVGQDRHAARGRLEQPPRRAPAHRRHRRARHVQRHPCRAVERGMLRRRQMAHEEDVRRPGELPRIL